MIPLDQYIVVKDYQSTVQGIQFNEEPLKLSSVTLTTSPVYKMNSWEAPFLGSAFLRKRFLFYRLAINQTYLTSFCFLRLLMIIYIMVENVHHGDENWNNKLLKHTKFKIIFIDIINIITSMLWSKCVFCVKIFSKNWYS